MPVEDVIAVICQNLGVKYEDLVLFMSILGSLILFAKDFRIGFIFITIISAGLSIMFYELKMDYIKSLIVMLTGIVLLALSLYISYYRQTRWII